MRILRAFAVIPVLLLSSVALAPSDALATQGRLDALDSQLRTLGCCPLKHTDVRAEIAGFVARVTVRQQFHNPYGEKIEAVYVFPLSEHAAVDRLTMRVGKRNIRGEIRERGEARRIYERAKKQGHVASLLDQERPNVFTQSVANIEPGEQVEITLSYVETLIWKDGEYQFCFPMVVEPRYMPGLPTGSPTTGGAPPTTGVPDADRISPPVTPEGTRAGHDISLTVRLNAGIPLQRVDSRQHAVDVQYKRKLKVSLPDNEPDHDVLAALWARAKIDELLATDLSGLRSGRPEPKVRQAVLDLGLSYRLLTQFTSFVAVEERKITEGGTAKTVSVPVEMPSGVSYEGVFGPRNDLLAIIGTYSATGYNGRGSAAARAALVRSGGGSDTSEAVVAAALQWLAKQQQSDGRWSFRASAGGNAGDANPSVWNSDVAATSFALLPFLGAGQTHKEGKYKPNVEAGLHWLVQQQRADGDLSGGTADLKTFAHAVATIAVCNTYGMTHDKTLREPAQGAVDFIVRTQDKVSGGWAADPGQAPAAWVTVWQIMALRSGCQDFLRIGRETRDKAAAFLEHLPDDGGGFAEEANSAARPDLALVARLVSRRYLDWEQGGAPETGGGQPGPASPAELRARPAFRLTLERLGQLGPSSKDTVYNLHVTRLLRSLGDSVWDTWNRQMRDRLVNSQIKSGDEAGSWWQPDDVRAAFAGRLFQTALNAMILEVYYLHLPLFQPMR